MKKERQKNIKSVKITKLKRIKRQKKKVVNVKEREILTKPLKYLQIKQN